MESLAETEDLPYKVDMPISYKKLFKKLIDLEMLQKDLIERSGITRNTLAKMKRGESITTDQIAKICRALECDVSEIMEYVPDEE